MSEVKPVSPDKYTFRPFVKVMTNPLARPIFKPGESMFLAGSATNVLVRSFGCIAVTMAISTPRDADARRMLRLAPKSRPAVHGVVRGNTVSFVKLLVGQPAVLEPVTAAINRPITVANGPPATIIEFLPTAISAVLLLAAGVGGTLPQVAVCESGFWLNLPFPK